MISDDFVKQKSLLWKIDERTIYREYLQWLFLQVFYQHKFSQSSAFFKGGTALRLLFRSFRFSEDLDFTCTGTPENLQAVIDEVVNFLPKETNLEVHLRDEKFFAKVGLGVRIVFSGKGFKQPLGIRLDFSFREKPLDGLLTVPICQDYPISMLPPIAHYSKKEITAEKIRAIFARNKNRDIFDLWFLLKSGENIPWDMVEEKMKYYPEIVFSKDLLVEKISSLKPADFTADLNQFLPVNYRNLYNSFLTELTQLIKQQV
ncbi:MAG: nucleotidyl transferase AbiEii/AbiGii toxin family protein [Patescibacteria group bacterium]